TRLVSPRFPLALNYTRSVRAGVNAQATVRLLAGAARRQLVTLDQLVLQPAYVSVLRRKFDHRVRRLRPADALERFLERGLRRVGRVELVHPAQRILDLGDGVALQHLDRNAARLRLLEGRVLAAVVVLEGDDQVRFLDMV